MNRLIEFVNVWGDRFFEFAGPMLWQSSVLITVLFVMDFAFRRRMRASVRYALWLIVIVKLLLPPTLALPTGVAWWIRPTPTPETQTRTFTVTYSGPELPSPIADKLVASALPNIAPPTVRLSFPGMCLFVSGLVAIGLLAWMLRRWWQVARMIRCASLPDDSLREILSDARRSLGLRRNVSVKLTEQPMSPAVCGLFRPVILLPRSLAKQLSPAQLRAVLLHELVHLKRGDVWVNCAQALLQIAYWWHPLLWLANARIRRVREEAVDDAVMLALRDESETYAPTLLEVAKLALARPLVTLGLVGIMESQRSLRHRIERLIDTRARRSAGISLLALLSVAVFSAVAIPMGEPPAKQLSPPRSRTKVEHSPSEHSENRDNKTTDLREVMQKVNQGQNMVGALVTDDNRKNMPIEVTASGTLNYDRDGGVTTATNGVIVKFGTSVLTADSAKVNHNTGEVFAKGNVQAQDNDRRFSADTLNYNFRTGAAQAEHVQYEDRPPAEGKTAQTNNRKAYIDRLTNNGGKTDFGPAKEGGSVTNRTSKSRQAIRHKLDSIRLEKVFFDRWTLVEVLDYLSLEAKKRDPENHELKFIIDHNMGTETNITIFASERIAGNRRPDLSDIAISLKPPMTDVLLVDVLNAIASVAPTPIQYGITDQAIVFSSMKKVEPLLRTRIFKVDPDTFYKGLEGFSSTPLNRTNGASVSSAVNGFFASLGVDFNSEPGKIIYFKDRKGLLLVRATKLELDTIESAIQVLNETPPQINLKVKFAEVPKELARKLLETIFTNATAGVAGEFTGLLSKRQKDEMIKALERTAGVNLLNAPEVTTLSGRQAQIQIVDLQTMVTGLTPVFTNGVTNLFPRTETMPFGTTLDVIPYVSADESTVQMTLTPIVSEFLGYDDPVKVQTTGRSKSALRFPRTRIRKMTTAAIVPDGQTVVLANLPVKEITRRPDGTETVKDVSSKSKKQLLIFVTPTIVDPAGNPLHTAK